MYFQKMQFLEVFRPFFQRSLTYYKFLSRSSSSHTKGKSWTSHQLKKMFALLASYFIFAEERAREKKEHNRYGQLHRRRTCDCNLTIFLRPISNLGVIWESYVLGLKSRVFVKTMDKSLRTHRAKMGTVVCPKIPKMPPHSSAQFVCPSPKV